MPCSEFSTRGRSCLTQRAGRCIFRRTADQAPHEISLDHLGPTGARTAMVAHAAAVRRPPAARRSRNARACWSTAQHAHLARSSARLGVSDTSIRPTRRLPADGNDLDHRCSAEAEIATARHARTSPSRVQTVAGCTAARGAERRGAERRTRLGSRVGPDRNGVALRRSCIEGCRFDASPTGSSDRIAAGITPRSSNASEQ